MTGKILLDEVDKSPYYFSTIQLRRYYPSALGFKGSPEEFAKFCEENPPDLRSSYTEISETWIPAFCLQYMSSEKFRKCVAEKCKPDIEKSRLEDLKRRFEKDFA